MKIRHLCYLCVLSVVASCSSQRKMQTLRNSAIGAEITPSEIEIPQELQYDPFKRDTLFVQDDQGNEIIIMKAVKDENGEMVANDIIDAARVTAKFRNVAERNGKVDIKFQIIVPKMMQDSKWQLRFRPVLTAFGEDQILDSIIISGEDYRKAQIRGYRQYDDYLNKIITDSTEFVDMKEAEIFLERNKSLNNVSSYQVMQHYTKEWKVRANDRRISKKQKMFAKYVKAPLITEGLRLDTVITSYSGDFMYEYCQTINTQPQLKSVNVTIDGDIFQEASKIYSIPESGPLTFYISSLSSFVDDKEKYLTRVIERVAYANSMCWIDFEQGSAKVDKSTGNNSEEIARIEKILADLSEDEIFSVDSILVTASCSPEGKYSYNESLSLKRSDSVAEYFRHYDNQSIKFISRNNPENWEMFLPLVKEDTTLTEYDKESISNIMRETNPDAREEKLSLQPYYRHLRESIYPKLRIVKFDFFLHRKDMVKDTVHTTVIDSTYMRGVQAIKDRDYKTAVTILRPYADFNTAVAYCALDYNVSAMTILQTLENTDKTEYMLAILFARVGNDKDAVQHYLNACRMNPSYVHRGNLDPEISALIKKYDLNKF